MRYEGSLSDYEDDELRRLRGEFQDSPIHKGGKITFSTSKAGIDQRGSMMNRFRSLLMKQRSYANACENSQVPLTKLGTHKRLPVDRSLVSMSSKIEKRPEKDPIK